MKRGQQTVSGSESPGRKAWKRLIRNKPAVAGMVIIALAVIVAILGYAITPDRTPNANDQINELSLMKPGFGVDILNIVRNRVEDKQGFLRTMIAGRTNPYDPVPVTAWEIAGDSMYYRVFSKFDHMGFDEVEGWYQRIHLADVVFALDASQNIIPPKKETDTEGASGSGPVYSTGTGYTLALMSGETIHISRSELERKAKAAVSHRIFILGTDMYGRCMFSRLILGVRISLMVGLVAVAIALTIGMLLGAVAGYFGGRTDDVVMFLVNTVWSIPTLLLVFAIMLALGRGFWQIFIAVGLTMWVDVARIVRGQIMSLREAQFVEAAVGFGFSHARIIGRHILPNILGPVMVIAAANFAAAILIEAGLSYLGFGIQPPGPSWGTMIRENYVFLFSNNPYPALTPAFAIMLMVLAFNLLGNGLRDALDVRTRL